ncbi:Magnesium-protoporphyrin O-methyltransferase [Corynebacterium atrinae]|uniref:class I SAM-dependent methyltransferase n=1 Tax=Corynebacterium atrinae TaxID=1336740 RepID=UPI0025B3E052|nr:class I SAM-dependent methyltransferase [Corynebacterium atrinae]WJY63004.1 Magnesium-protoporphyrin O-methyltransferase [Corynebacterium atrinae]
MFENNFFSSNFADAKLDNKIERTTVEVDWLQREVGSFRTVLDLGCGRGRLAIELAGRGYSVIAIDINKQYLDIAKERGGSLPIEWRL